MVNSNNLANYNSRFAYIFPASVLGNMQHGDTINSIEFTREAGLTVNNNCNLKIYLRNTTLTDYGSSNLLFSSRTGTATLVYDQNPAAEITTSEGFQKIPFYNNLFFFDTTKGKNLELLVEYSQTAVQPARIYWYYENSTTVSGYAMYQTKYYLGTALNDTLKTSSDNHPTIIFNFPRYDHDIALLKLYTLGKLPIPLGNPDSVKAMVRNVGKKQQSAVKVKTWSKGFNSQVDSSTFSIGTGQQIFINLPSLNPQKKGLDTVYACIYADNNTINDTSISYRLGNENIYSYKDVTQPAAPGGIGFNGQTGDFVGRFFSNKSKSINQVTVEFAISGRSFKVGIWESKSYGEGPGNLIYISDSLVTTAGKYILNLKKPVSVNGAFFVGVRQLNGNNVAFGYQIEDIVRPNTFYYTSPAGDTNWVDFHPDIPFRFLMEPRLQGDTDLTAVSADYPKDTLDKYSISLLAPQGTISNLGTKDLLDSFPVTCEILFSGKSVYKFTYRDTMSSGVKRTYTFPKTFDPKNFGEHELLIYTSLTSDQIRDNDTARRKFYVGVKNDAMVATVYEPANNAILECFVDTIQPVATIQNPSYNDINTVVARCKIVKGNTILYNRTQTINLPKFNSRILVWPTYKCNDTGKLRVIYTTEYSLDVFKANDTQIRNVTVVKSYDAGVDSIALPDKNKFYVAGVAFKPSIRTYNDGILDAANTQAIINIFSNYTTYTYADTVSFTIDAKTQYFAQFKKFFKPDKNGIYTLVVKLFHPSDNVHWNDSLRIKFNVGYPYDYLSKQIVYPVSSDTLSVGGGPYQVKTKIKNNGFIRNSDLVPVICQIWRNNIRIYQDIKTLNLDTGIQFDLDFSNNFNPLNSGKHKVVMFTNYVSDVNRKNDTLTSEFWVKVGRDAYASDIDTPVANWLYEARTSVIPFKAEITNAGNLKMAQIRVYVDVFYKGKLVFTDKKDDSLNAFQVKNILFGKTFIPQDTGKYQLLVYTYAADDQNIYNDTFFGEFQVVKKYDAAAFLWQKPTSGSTFIEGTAWLKPTIAVLNAGMDTATHVSGTVYFTIEKTTGGLVFSDSGSFSNIKYADTTSVSTSDSWQMNIVGIYKARVIVKANDAFPENDTLWTVFEIQTNSVTDVHSKYFKIQPNPVSDLMTIILHDNLEIKEYHLLDQTGKQMTMNWKSENVADLSNLAPGIYTIQLVTNLGIFSERIVHP
ncbi:MAG: T9SS type A sorting domain-containing protein [Bacteroidetes bacterium]|nr:T9SS type A sorting domain-containing protein [Bacteroidota bacterium]